MADKMTTPNTFDSRIENWLTEQRQPWGRLRYKLTQANLAKHLGQDPLYILDAGGGNGVDSLPLAEKGHSVTIVDYSGQMLRLAAEQAEAAQIQDRASLHRADVIDIPILFPEPRFDLVLCHNVLQYIEDVPSLLKGLRVPLKAGGLISLISVNRYSIPYHAAFLRGDLAEALTGLDTHTTKGIIFDATLTNYSAAEIKEMLQDSGFKVIQDYGLRCLCDYWGDNERKSDPMTFEQLEKLELALTDRHPYKLLARYYQVIARKI